ncbi:MAG: YtxH domain-containing protein [Bacteroidetes Order II. Incertae sedis bacterium]|nr:YtxH domain-containing protein [Bacteroidetes Order II. bacterium]
MSKERSNGLLGFLVGGALGLAVGLLIAPEQGEKLRRKVAYRVKQGAQQISALLEAVKEEEDMESVARRDAQEVVEVTTTEAQQLLAEMDEVMNSARMAKNAVKDATLN